jgi:hypothetical protein
VGFQRGLRLATEHRTHLDAAMIVIQTFNDPNYAVRTGSDSLFQIPFGGLSHPRVEPARLLHQFALDQRQPAHVVVAEAQLGRPSGFEDRLTPRPTIGGQVVFVAVD